MNKLHSLGQTEERKPDIQSNDPYAILGIHKSTNQRGIKKAYFALIRKYPPETETEKFKIIRGAYDKIKSTNRRAETDLFLLQPPPKWRISKKKIAIDIQFHIDDAFFALQSWTDLEHVDFESDFREIDL